VRRLLREVVRREEYTLMGKWRTLFEASLPPVGKRAFGVEYEFAPPATVEQLAAAERALGVRLPAEVRELLFEFNGVWYTTTVDRDLGYEPSISYLDVEHMAGRVWEYFRKCGNVLPPEADLRKVVFIYQGNGFGELYGVCVEAVAGHRAGAVVKLDHEIGELQRGYTSLADFVRRGPK
jgi:hypothetical protein